MGLIPITANMIDESKQFHQPTHCDRIMGCECEKNS